ncbi:MAG: NADH-quinone oxidoreductase subunit N [Candidatus Hodarchaeales archaeon]|jgi:NADH-quinone oxidoreductase subunit N
MSNIAIVLSPFLVLIGTMIICLLLEAFNIARKFTPTITIIGGFLALYSVILNVNGGIFHLFGNPEDFLDINFSYGIMVIDDFYRFFAIIFLIVLIFVSISSSDYMKTDHNLGVYYSLLILATMGMMVLAAANDLLLIFVAWELASLPVYSLAAYQKSRAETSESALKFFLIGAMSSAFILFGISLVYGITSSTGTLTPTSLATVMSSFADLSNYSPLHVLALMFLFVGFGYKMAAVPFHAWAVDVYQGTPTAITTYLAAGSKAMGFAAIMRIVVVSLVDLGEIWGIIFALLAVLTMTLGNVVALVQTNIKRMLAYSSIAHAGYILIALAAAASKPEAVLSDFSVGTFSMAAAEFHILTHAVMKIVAFTVVIVVSFSVGSEEISDFAGLRKRHPWIVFAMTISLLSLLGVPPLAGFISKLFIFFSAIYAELYWLAFIGVINSAISVFYYIRVIKLMILDPPAEELLESHTVSVESMRTYRIPVSYAMVIGIGVILIILIGVIPEAIFDFAVNGAKSFSLP